MEKTPKTGKLYWCELCGYETNVYTNWQAHLNRHSGERPHQCRHCPQAFASAADLNRHERYHSDARPFKCTICSYATKTDGDLKAHVKRHSDVRPHKCNICGNASKTSGDLKKHMLTHSDHKPFKCSICAFATKSAYVLHNHTRRHTDDKPYTCQSCSFATRHQYSLVHHVQLVHSGRPIEKRFKCDGCDYAARTKSCLVYHKQTVHADKPHTCHLCNAQFKHKFTLKHHISVLHNREEEVVCPVCKKTYSSKSSFLTHIRKHEQGNLVKCPQCPKTFVWEGSLRRHMRAVHVTSQRQLVCRLCGAAFTSHRQLKKHISRHHEKHLPLAITDENRAEVRKYLHLTCPVCYLTFTSLLRLQKHVKMHEQETEQSSTGSSQRRRRKDSPMRELPMIYVNELPDHVVQSHQLTTQPKVCLTDLRITLTGAERARLHTTKSLLVTSAFIDRASVLPHHSAPVPSGCLESGRDAAASPVEVSSQCIKMEPEPEVSPDVTQICDVSCSQPSTAESYDSGFLIRDVRSCDQATVGVARQVRPIEIKPAQAFSLREIVEMSLPKSGASNSGQENSPNSLQSRMPSSSYNVNASSEHTADADENVCCISGPNDSGPETSWREQDPDLRRKRDIRLPRKLWFDLLQDGHLTIKPTKKKVATKTTKRQERELAQLSKTMYCDGSYKLHGCSNKNVQASSPHKGRLRKKKRPGVKEPQADLAGRFSKKKTNKVFNREVGSYIGQSSGNQNNGGNIDKQRTKKRKNKLCSRVTENNGMPKTTTKKHDVNLIFSENMKNQNDDMTVQDSKKSGKNTPKKYTKKKSDIASSVRSNVTSQLAKASQGTEKIPTAKTTNKSKVSKSKAKTEKMRKLENRNIFQSLMKIIEKGKTKKGRPKNNAGQADKLKKPRQLKSQKFLGMERNTANTMKKNRKSSGLRKTKKAHGKTSKSLNRYGRSDGNDSSDLSHTADSDWTTLYIEIEQNKGREIGEVTSPFQEMRPLPCVVEGPVRASEESGYLGEESEKQILTDASSTQLTNVGVECMDKGNTRGIDTLSITVNSSVTMVSNTQNSGLQTEDRHDVTMSSENVKLSLNGVVSSDGQQDAAWVQRKPRSSLEKQNFGMTTSNYNARDSKVLCSSNTESDVVPCRPGNTDSVSSSCETKSSASRSLFDSFSCSFPGDFGGIVVPCEVSRSQPRSNHVNSGVAAEYRLQTDVIADKATELSTSANFNVSAVERLKLSLEYIRPKASTVRVVRSNDVGKSEMQQANEPITADPSWRISGQNIPESATNKSSMVVKCEPSEMSESCSISGSSLESGAKTAPHRRGIFDTVLPTVQYREESAVSSVIVTSPASCITGGPSVSFSRLLGVVKMESDCNPSAAGLSSAVCSDTDVIKYSDGPCGANSECLR